MGKKSTVAFQPSLNTVAKLYTIIHVQRIVNTVLYINKWEFYIQPNAIINVLKISDIRTILKNGEDILIAEGYMWEFGRRGYLKYGEYTPEVGLEHPDLV